MIGRIVLGRKLLHDAIGDELIPVVAAGSPVIDTFINQADNTFNASFLSQVDAESITHRIDGAINSKSTKAREFGVAFADNSNKLAYLVSILASFEESSNYEGSKRFEV